MTNNAPCALAPAVFNFQESHPLRVVAIDGEPWFVAADVCTALELGSVTKSLLRLDDDEATLISIQGRTPTGGKIEQQVNVINESGLYSLILGSRKPEAKKFKKWVTAEVLPAIRKTGYYLHPAAAATAAEYLTVQDQRNIKRIIWDIAAFMGNTSGWTQGTWFSLRHATRNPSPQPFTTDHLPLIAEDLLRILNTAKKLRHYTLQLEKEVLKTVIRGGGNIDELIAREEAHYAATLAEITNSATSALSGWQLREIAAVANRTAMAHNDFREFGENEAR